MEIDYAKLAAAIVAAQEAAAGRKRRSSTFRLVILKVLNFFIYMAVILLAVAMT